MKDECKHHTLIYIVNIYRIYGNYTAGSRPDDMIFWLDLNLLSTMTPLDAPRAYAWSIQWRTG